MRTKIILYIFILIVFTSLAYAQYTGPGSMPYYTTVGQVMKKPVDDANVFLQGNITKQIGKERYIFKDSTGEIRVEIDNDKFPKGQQVDEKTQVEIYGEIDMDSHDILEIDVKFLKIIK